MKNDRERDHRLMTVVVTALQQPAEQRQSFLQGACHDDAQLYEEASETLEWEERMGNFLLEPLLVFKDFEKPFHPGEIICERFEIVREIGEGGMGVVYEAHDRKRNQRIAIKSAKTGFRHLLTPELQSALQVRHPNICLVNEIHTATTAHGEVDFLTMEFLDGEPLSDALSSGDKFSPKQALEIACQLCTGLSEAHRSGIVHRDLKSANIILCGSIDGKLRVVITDFGLAGAAMSGPGELAGTPRYMAPELWQGEAASKASDIYALGVILYEVVAGRPPFAENQEELVPNASIAAAPSSCVKGLDRRWDAAILPCLDRSPSARPADAAMVLAQLQKKPVRKAPLLALALLIIAGLTPAVRGPLLEQLRPAKVRLAILPATGADDTTAMGKKILQNVSDHLRRLRSGGAIVAVMSPVETQKRNVQTTEQAREALHATHILEVKLRRDGSELDVEASIVEAGAKTHLREFSGRYAPEIAEDVPTALAGFVSAGLRLHGDAVADPVSPAAKESYDHALYFLRRDTYSYDQAEALFNEAARSDPHSPSPLAGLAEAQIQKFQRTKERRYLEDARRSLSRAEALNPDSPRVHLASGLLNETTGQYGRALEDYQRVQDIDPGNVSALLRLARIYDAQNLPDKAIENCQKAIKLEPDTPLPYQQLGLLYYYHGKYLLAAEQFQKAVERDHHRSADAYVNLGIAMMELGREAEAEQALLTSLTIREDAHALNTLGTIRDQQGREAEAAGYYRRAVALEPGNYTDWLNLGDSERRLGHLAEARAAYRKLKELALVELQQNPSRGRIRAFVAYAKLRLGQKAAAEEEINEALHSAPGNSQVIQLAVLIYETLGQRNQTIDVLRGSTPEGIREIEHERELAALHQDPRFLELVAKAQEGGHN